MNPVGFRPLLELVEARLTPAFAHPFWGLVAGAVLTPAAEPGLYRVIAAYDGTEVGTVRPFEDGFSGEVRTATEDITGDGYVDLVVAAGPGGGPRVRVLDGRTEAVVADFFAFGQDFRGGVYVAAGDVNQDGVGDLVTGAGEGGGPRVRVYDGRSGGVLADFFAFEESFRGGVRVAAADVDTDRVAEVVAAAGPGGGPRVALFDVTPTVAMIDAYLAYEADFRGGVYVTAIGNGTALLGGRYPGFHAARVITAPGPGREPSIRDVSGEFPQAIVAGDPASRTGVRLANHTLFGFVTETPTPDGPVLRGYVDDISKAKWTRPAS